MSFRRHFKDLSGTTIASASATGLDAIVYTTLTLTLIGQEWFNIGLAAFVAALAGGVLHYSLCRFWVFRRFQAPLLESLILYLAMSWLAASGHAVLTHWLATMVGAAFAWTISKIIFWLIWTYPLSRYVVFNDDELNQLS